MTDCISNSPSKLLAVIPLAVPDTLDIVTKSPSIAPCVASVTVTDVDPEVVVNSVIDAPLTRIGVMS